MMYGLLRMLHFAALLVLAMALVLENIATRPRINQEDIRNLVRIDTVGWLAVFSATLFGLLLWFIVGRPASFYSANPLFHAKLGMVALLIVAALYPLYFYHRQCRSSAETVAVPRLLRLVLRLELLLLVLIAILASLMARGVGLAP